MQQAIYTNAHIAASSPNPGHGTGYSDNPGGNPVGVQRFKKLRLLLSVVGNVLGGAILLSGMLMLPQLFVSLLAN